ncbi:MAG TPA: SPOR domain-containing protein [Thermoanaerobaculia bacterium]|jgi:cell division septation protein DedD
MEEVLTDDQSHYEISLTAGQAFVAFVLLLLSLAASFAFGLMIGKGQTDDHLVVRKEPAAVINEATSVAPKKVTPKVAEVANDDFKPSVVEPAPQPVAAPAPAKASVPAFAQILSTSDQKTAEALAAKLIEGGFTAAYVERTTTEKGTIFRVRIKFPSEAEAHAAEPKLKAFSKDVWITK